MLGASLTLFRKSSSHARLYSLSVAPFAQGRGVGRTLLQAGEARARDRGCTQMRLEVRQSNKNAIALYERLGYIATGTKPGYYPDGEDAILMQHDLVGQQGSSL